MITVNFLVVQAASSNTAWFLAVEAEVSLKNSWVLMLQNETKCFKILHTSSQC